MATPSLKVTPDLGAVPFTSLHDVQERIRLEGITKHAEQCAAEVNSLLQERDRLRLEVASCSEREVQLESELDLVIESLANLEIQNDAVLNKIQRTKLNRQQTQIELSLTSLRNKKKELEDEAEENGRELNEAEKSLSKFSELADGVKGDVELSRRKQSLLAEQRLAMEHRAAERLVNGRLRDERRREEAIREAEANAQLQASRNRLSRDSVMPLIERKAAELASIARAREAEEEAEEARRIAAILGLKSSRDKVADREALRHRKKMREEEEAKKAREKEAKELLAQGKNPEAVFLAREREAKAAQRQAEIAERTRMHERDIVGRILQEEAREAKRSSESRRGSTLLQKRGSTSSTRRRSKERTHDDTFQSGTLNESVDKEENTSTAEAASVIEAGQSEAQPRIQQQSKANIQEDSNLAFEEEDYAKPEFEGLWNNDSGAAVPRPKLPTKADVDRRMVNEALARQRSAREKQQVQVVAGHKFTGPAFRADPPKILFDDFEAGQQYSMKVTLTNNSLGLNSFKLLPPPTEFIEFDFVPTKPLSSGMSTDITVRFHPRANVEYSGEVSLLAQTGVFTIPLLCSPKRCCISAIDPTLSFGNLEFGERRTKRIVLKNTGALGTSWTAHLNTTTDVPDLASVEEALSSSSIDVKMKHHSDSNDDVKVDVETECSERSEEHDQQPDHQAAQSTQVCDGVSEESTSDVDKGNADVPSSHKRNNICVATTNEITSGGDSACSATQFSLVSDAEGYLEPHCDTTLLIECVSTNQPDAASASLVIQFSDGTVSDINIDIDAVCVPPAVRTVEPVIQLGVVKCGHRYLRKTSIRNDRDGTAKVLFKVPDQYQSCIDVVPAEAMIPANSVYNVEIQFQPTLKFYHELGSADCATDEEIAIEELAISCTITAIVEGQKNATSLVLDAILTPARLYVRPTTLEFGRVSVFETAVASITISSRSSVPEPFTFEGLPEFVTIQPSNGVGILPPGASKSLDVLVSPPQNLGNDEDYDFQFPLICRWDGQPGKHRVDCSGTAVVPALQLSASRIYFKAISSGSEAVASVNLLNRSRRKSRYRFLVPSSVSKEIMIHPICGVIDRGATHNVRIYHVSAELGSDRELDIERNITTQSIRTDSKSSQRLEMIQCVMEPLSTGESGTQMQQTNILVDPARVLNLELCLQHAEPVINVEPSRMEFPNLPMGGTATMTLRICNISENEQFPVVSGLDPLGPFELASAVRPIHSGGEQVLKISFVPTSLGHYLDFLKVSTGPTSARIRISGVCSEATIELGPPEILNHSVLDIGNCVVGGHVTSHFTMKNTSSFGISYVICMASELDRSRELPAKWNCLDVDHVSQLRSANDNSPGLLPYKTGYNSLTGCPEPVLPDPRTLTVGAKNVNGTPAFVFDPCVGRLGVGETAEIAVTFSPDRVGIDFADAGLVWFSDAAQPKHLYCKGRGRPSVFIEGYDIGHGDIASGSLAAIVPDRHAPVPITLSFDCSKQASGKELYDPRKLIFGISPGGVRQAKAEFAFEQPSNRAFKIEQSKGALDSGSTKSVSIWYSPQEALSHGNCVRDSVLLKITVGSESTDYVVHLVAAMT